MKTILETMLGAITTPDADRTTWLILADALDAWVFRLLTAHCVRNLGAGFVGPHWLSYRRCSVLMPVMLLVR